MRQLISSKTMKNIITLLSMIAIAKLIGLIVLFFLPKSGVEIASNDVNSMKYRSYKVSNSFGLVTNKKKKPPKAPPKEVLRIDSLILHALYGDDIHGFIVFAEKKAPLANIILALNHDYKGYKLTHIKPQSAILEKGGKAYELLFKELTSSIPLQNRVSVPIPKDLGNTDVVRAVSKKDVMHYAKNFDSIWKNIAIKEIKKDGKIDGFKVISVNKSSIFARLGLLRGDIITSVNNQSLKSYADAFNIYNNIKDYDSLKISIIRNKQKKELEYEIF